MAELDTEGERVVLRIVYDGPAMAGKTTSVRSLAKMFDRPVFSSESADGRTLHFDWMVYQGGRFENHSVCCQVVAVPGQPELWPRRRFLLETADVVVFVADSRPTEFEASLAALESLRSLLSQLPHPRPGVVFQLNKRDLADVVPLAQARARLAAGETVAVTESVAAEDVGVRQTFVFAVRLALDRVNELRSLDRLRVGPPIIEGGEALLAALLEHEGGGVVAATEPASAVTSSAMANGVTRLPEAVEFAPPARPRQPTPPNPDLPVGRVWPPVEGRAILHEANAARIELVESPTGDWLERRGHWIVQSAANALYLNADLGRAALVEWARWHATLGRHLSPHRALALSEDEQGVWRLWQVVRREKTVGQVLSKAFGSREVDSMARTLLLAARALAEVDRALSLTGLRVDLDNVSILESGPVFVALAPTPRELATAAQSESKLGFDLESCFAPLLDEHRGEIAAFASAVVERMRAFSRNWGIEDGSEPIFELLLRRSGG